MASQSLYRKWRSQTFSDLIGQEAVTRTLLNAVRDGRLAHAYLLCGPRGIGKTSVARLLAKAINCQNPHDGEPCNVCVSCQEIAAGRSPDVIEIDGASNNGVEDIRKIRENINLIGSGGHFKIYIIDEAHMITSQAFNALLKTLEEPPPHIIFVFATTEAHKMLPTVVSRCQRFDFRRIRMVDIVARLKHVAAGEGLTLEPAAADLLARAAQGGLRDALSLLDQAVALCGAHVDLERARMMLGLADVGSLRRLIACIAEDRAADALDLLNELVTQGADLRQLNSQFAEEWRALMLARAGADLTRVMDYTVEEARELGALAEQFTLDDLMACARVFARNEGPARGLPLPQLALELSLLECLSVRRHEAAPTQVRPAPPAVAPSQAPQRPPTRATPPAAPPAASAAPVAPVAPVEELDLAAIDAGTWAGPTREVNAAASPVHAASAAAPEAPAETPAEAPGAEESAEGLAESWEDVASPDGSAGRDWVAEAQRNWPLIRKVCRQKPPMGAVVSGLLSDAEPFGYEPGNPQTLIIRAKYDFHLNSLRDHEKRKVVEWALEQALGQPFRAHFVPANEPQRGAATVRRQAGAEASPAPGASLAQSAAAQRPQVYERGAANGADAANNGHRATSSQASKPPPAGRAELRERPAQPAPSSSQLEQAAREDPVVQEFARMLNAEVSDVRPLKPPDADES